MPHRAGFWVRVLAAALDGVAMMFVTLVVGVAVFAMETRTSYALAPGGFEAVMSAICLLYTAPEVFAAATPGKLLLRLRICNVDGTAADPWRLFLRWSTKWLWLILSFAFALTEWAPLYLLSGFVSLVVVIGCFFAANDDRLTWHDQWAHTAVCRRPRTSRAFPPTPPPLPPVEPPAQQPPRA